MSHRIRGAAVSAAIARDRGGRAAGYAPALPSDAGTRWETWTKQA